MSDVRHQAEMLFRQRYGELLASLLRIFGYARFDLVEESLQTAFERALEKWPVSGVPENAVGWLYAVARNACLERLRHVSMADRKAGLVRADSGEAAEEPAADRMIPGGLDDFAAMILLCCNPDLSERSQVCLMLKAGCGLSVREIGRLLGMADEAVKKTLTRAKTRLSQDTGVFSALDEGRIASRFPLVLETVYALFTEGYAASHGDVTLRRDVAVEAVHLGDVLLGSQFTPSASMGSLQALMALMLLQLARFDARVGNDGVPVRLEDQDRSRWNGPMIHAGLDALRAAMTTSDVSQYHLEARIAAEHATSPTFAETNWPLILETYDRLLSLKDTQAVRLNRIVAIRYAKGPARALEELDGLADGPGPAATAYLTHSVRADCLEALGRRGEARQAWSAALASAPTRSDRAFVEGRLRSAQVDVPAAPPRASS